MLDHITEWEEAEEEWVAEDKDWEEEINLRHKFI